MWQPQEALKELNTNATILDSPASQVFKELSNIERQTLLDTLAENIFKGVSKVNSNTIPIIFRREFAK